MEKAGIKLDLFCIAEGFVLSFSVIQEESKPSLSTLHLFATQITFALTVS